MVTHDPFVASYCKRILFIKDGKLFTELVKGEMSQEKFSQKLLRILSALEVAGMTPFSIIQKTCKEILKIMYYTLHL